jgi:predicted dehydrogenase
MYTVGIIGAGSIGATKPDNIDHVHTLTPLTHAHAVYNNIQLQLNWIADVDKKKGVAAAKKWNTIYVDRPEIAAASVDILVVAVPTEDHLQTMIEILGDDDNKPHFSYKPKLIVLEKPAGINIYEANKIQYMSSQASVPIVVNYGRRFCPEIMSVYNDIVGYELAQSAVFYYTRGLIRDGSHAIDILNRFFGDYIQGEILDNGLNDYSDDDLTYLVKLSYSRCGNILLIPCDGRLFDVFELHIMTQNGTLIYDEHFKHVYWIVSKKEPTYGNYKSLPSSRGLATFVKTNLEYSLQNLYVEVRMYLDKEISELSCTMSDALRVHNVLNKLLLAKEKKEKDNVL